MGLLGDIGNAVKGVVTSPVLQTAAGVTAMVFPPVGVPAVAAVTAANVAIKAIDSAQPDRRAEGRQLAVNTALASKAGNTDARRALQTMALVKRSKTGRRPPTLRTGASPARAAQQAATATKEQWLKLKAALDNAKEEGRRAGQLQAIAAMRKHKLRGIMMGQKEIKHGDYVAVP